MLNGLKKWKSRSGTLPWLERGPKKDLLEAFQRGEEWAFGEIYARYHKPTLKYVSKRIDDSEAVQDLTQEIFLKIHRFRESYDLDARFESWFWTVAKNTVVDWHRKYNLGEASEISQAQEPDEYTQGYAIVDRLACPLPDAEYRVLQKANRKMLRTLMKQLTSLQRRVIWLRVIHQLSYQEISKRLGLSLSAVKCLAYRSRQVIREMGHVPSFA